jgi:hypothetical protein
VSAQTYPLLIAVGAEETDEFKDQSRQLYNTCKNKTASIELLELQGLNHFSILDAIVNENASLHKEMIRFIEA